MKTKLLLVLVIVRKLTSVEVKVLQESQVEEVLVLSNHSQSILSYLPKPEDITVYERDKPLLKRLRSTEFTLLIVHVDNEESEKSSLNVCRYLRQSLADNFSSIVVVKDQDYILSTEKDFERYQVDDIISLRTEISSSIENKLNRIISAKSLVRKMLANKQAQIDLLMTVNSFIRLKQNTQVLLGNCAEALARFCSASATCIASQNDLNVCLPDGSELGDEDLNHLKENGLTDLVTKAFSKPYPNIDLLPNSGVSTYISELCGCPIGSFLVFPIRVFEKTLVCIICFISDANMTEVSTQHLAIMRDTAEQLQLVIERKTAENRLKHQYKRLKSTLSELHSTQEQLVHAEKMASVGHMAAGLAHEINNPISFVISNFGPLDDYISTLVKMLELHDELVKSIDGTTLKTPTIQEAIHHFKQESEIDFVVDDMKAIVNDSREGLLRVRDIIGDLGSFTHAQNVEKNSVDVAELINETRVLLKFELGEKITVRQKIDIEKPINAHRGFMQQIFTHVIKNSAQALATQSRDDGCVEISAFSDEENHHILIVDNGPGMSNEELSKVFDYFYTTKEIGQGTGLGLSVSYNLAKKMGGKLAVESQLNKGTKVKLSLPHSV